MSNPRLSEIDLLRFFAALSVVFFHYSFRGYAADEMTIMPYPPLASVSKYGYLGVELFFMISGFVILLTAESGSLRRFVISRIVRLYPAFWACCSITFLAILLIGGARYSATVSQYLANMTMLSGFLGVKLIDGAYWSLFYEMRFYALVAAVLVIRRIQYSEFLILLWLVASIALVVNPIGILNYLLICDYSAFFIAGATYYLVWSKGISNLRIGVITVSWCLAIFQSTNRLRLLEKHYGASMNPYIVIGIITTFFAVMMLISLRRTGFLGRTNWLLAGSLTYPLYLLHQNIGFMVFNCFYPAVNSNVLFWGMIVSVIISAYGVYNFIEKPLAPPMKKALNSLANRISA